MSHKCTTANTTTTWQHAAHTINKLLSPSHQRKKPNQKAYLLTKNTEELSEEKKSGEWASRQEKRRRRTQNSESSVLKKRKKKTERAMGVGRRTREETVKWNQMAALSSRQCGDIDILGLPSEQNPHPPMDS